MRRPHRLNLREIFKLLEQREKLCDIIADAVTGEQRRAAA